jgi:hypothetical protein
MIASPLARKLRMKPGMRALIIAPPPGYLKSLAPLPEGFIISPKAAGTYAFVQIFATNLAEIGRCSQTLAKHAGPQSLVWIAYPKKTSGIESDISRDIIREAMREAGWDTVSIVAIDEVWSALRFRKADEVPSRRKRSSS